MMCPCPRPLDISETTMTCPEGDRHLREIIDRRIESRVAELLKTYTAEDITDAARILWGTGAS